MKKLIFIISVFLTTSCSCQNFFMTHTHGHFSIDTTVNTDAFITEWNMPSGDFTLPLRSGYTYNMTVDWGDGSALSTVTAYDDVDATHSYSAGTYQITILGTCATIYINNGSVKTYLTKVIQWGNVNFDNFNNSFYGASNLTYLPFGAITGVSGVGSLNGAFENCSGLTSLPSGMFDNFSSSLGLLSLFQGCSGLTSIPSGLLDVFTGTINFTSVFYGCSSLTSIPSGLFDYNTSVTNFINTFRGCNSLSEIPANLFDNNDAVTSFQNCFYGCTSLTGSSGELWLNPSGAGNYTLSAPDYDTGVPNGQDCYRDCTGLSDYASIPTYWK